MMEPIIISKDSLEAFLDLKCGKYGFVVYSVSKNNLAVDYLGCPAAGFSDLCRVLDENGEESCGFAIYAIHGNVYPKIFDEQCSCHASQHYFVFYCPSTATRRSMDRNWEAFNLFYGVLSHIGRVTCIHTWKGVRDCLMIEKHLWSFACEKEEEDIDELEISKEELIPLLIDDFNHLYNIYHHHY